MARLPYWRPSRQSGAAPDLIVDVGAVDLPRFYEEASGHWGVHLRYGLLNEPRTALCAST